VESVNNDEIENKATAVMVLASESQPRYSDLISVDSVDLGIIYACELYAGSSSGAPKLHEPFL
jgi:hypothetical protein